MSITASNPAFRELERQFNVVLPDKFGNPLLGFRDGVWYRLSGTGIHGPVLLRWAILNAPHAAGSIVQIVCWWMRENNRHSRALDLATELALTVTELAQASSDELGSSLSDNPPPRNDFDPLGSSSSGMSGAFATSSVPHTPAPSPQPSWPPMAPAASLVPDPRLGDSLGGTNPTPMPPTPPAYGLPAHTPAPPYGLPSPVPPPSTAGATTVMPAIRGDAPPPFNGERSGGDHRAPQDYRQPPRPASPRPANTGTYATPPGQYDREAPRYDNSYDDRPRRHATPREPQRPTPPPRRDW
jgi:hypothetical protein